VIPSLEKKTMLSELEAVTAAVDGVPEYPERMKSRLLFACSTMIPSRLVGIDSDDQNDTPLRNLRGSNFTPTMSRATGPASKNLRSLQ
jgi:hypothetical protein